MSAKKATRKELVALLREADAWINGMKAALDDTYGDEPESQEQADLEEFGRRMTAALAGEG